MGSDVEVTAADREKAAKVAGWALGTGRSTRELADTIAQALADERAKARAPFLALAKALDRLADESAGALVKADEVVGGCARDIRRAAEDPPEVRET